ncbi:MAG TPA: hydantoinase/oxoprolinase family protein [Anaerolineales bacterium]|nr:hydantoinase/oxoprolinase family protein [Anaerolineales bacterium]
MTSRIRFAIDIGGTFTDLVAFDAETGRIKIAKALTTPRDPATGVLDAVRAGQLVLEEAEAFVHGTTVVVNAITERKGARTALVTTAGFRDVLEIARANRPDMYNFHYHKPKPFVPRHLRFEVRERIARDGLVITPLHLGDLDPIIDACRAGGVEALAVCFLHSYADPSHESSATDYLRERLPGVAVAASHEVSRQWREYERTSATVLNAYVQPTAASYLASMESSLRSNGLGGEITIMQSSGGTATLAMARARPIALLESGPVAGVAGAARLGEVVGEQNIVSLDIGGTTVKCSLVEDGQLRITTDYRIESSPTSAGYPIQAPTVDIVEIGAGGGSSVRLDASGVLRVGPESAGADPGPACYGRGGTEPTVTDAALLAGWLDPDYFLGGQLKVNLERARAAYANLGDALGMSAEEAAVGALRLVNANMSNALKLVSIERGHDPRDFALVVHGGGGAMHGALLARELRFKKVVVPRAPGVFSAWGMLLVDPRIDLVRTRVGIAESLMEVKALIEDMKNEARQVFGGEGLRFEITADMRYLGQEHTVRVPLSMDLTVEAVAEAFHTAHSRRYRFALRSTPVEFVNFHLSAYKPSSHPPIQPLTDNQRGKPLTPKSSRRAHFDSDGWHLTPIYERDDLSPGFERNGPAIVEELTTTTLVPPGMQIAVDNYGNLHISE